MPPRPSPSVSATLWPNRIRLGHDGQRWISQKRGRSKVFRWYKVKATGKTKRTAKRTTHGKAKRKTQAKAKRPTQAKQRRQTTGKAKRQPAKQRKTTAPAYHVVISPRLVLDDGRALKVPAGDQPAVRRWFVQQWKGIREDMQVSAVRFVGHRLHATVRTTLDTPELRSRLDPDEDGNHPMKWHGQEVLVDGSKIRIKV